MIRFKALNGIPQSRNGAITNTFKLKKKSLKIEKIYLYNTVEVLNDKKGFS